MPELDSWLEEQASEHRSEHATRVSHLETARKALEAVCRRLERLLDD